MNTSPTMSPQLRRLWVYSTAAMVLLVAVFSLVTVLQQSANPLRMVLAAALSVAPCYLAYFWDRRPPLWLSVTGTTAAAGLWLMSQGAERGAIGALVPALCLSIVVCHTPITPWLRIAIPPLTMTVLGAAIGQLGGPDSVVSYAFAGMWCGLLASITEVASVHVWQLTRQIDQARETEHDLAVLQERTRVAAELHDIQGHTLHVLRLTMQLARKTLPSDPEMAASHLRTAEALVEDTLAETQNIVWGQRSTTLAAELANAEALCASTAIAWNTSGTLGTRREPEAEDLLALLLREAMTNLLRHSHASSVTVTITERGLRIDNDGVVSPPRAPRGLKQLDDRFTKMGGKVVYGQRDNHFYVEGSLS